MTALYTFSLVSRLIHLRSQTFEGNMPNIALALAILVSTSSSVCTACRCALVQLPRVTLSR